MKSYQTIHLYGKGMKYLGNIMASLTSAHKSFSDELKKLVEQWGDKRKVCYVTFK